MFGMKTFYFLQRRGALEPITVEILHSDNQHKMHLEKKQKNSAVELVKVYWVNTDLKVE